SRCVTPHLHLEACRVAVAVCRRGNVALHLREPVRRLVRYRLARLGDRLRARDLPARCGRGPHVRLLALPPAGGGPGELMDVALSRTGAWMLRTFFLLVVLFLYAPIAVLLIFSFNDSAVPTFPLSGFTLHWYHQFLTNSELRGALENSAIVAAVSSLGAVVLGVFASRALTRRRFRGKAAVSALLLSPLVIP